MIMKVVHNIDIDLNLLYTLHILIEEQSVSKAASRLALSQSAVSHSLNKLREYFNDRLLVKTRNGMVPTLIAEELRGDLRILIENVNGLFRKDQFDPAIAKGTVRVAATDYGLSIIFPMLMERLSVAAPNLKIDCVPLSTQIGQDLQNGVIDISLGGYKPFAGARHEVLFYDRYVGVVRSGHPILQDRISKESLLQWKHVFIKVPIRTERKDRLYKMLGRRTSDDFYLQIPYHMVASFSVEKNDMILIMPEKGAVRLTQMIDVATFELPVKMSRHAYLLSWHRKTDNNKMLQWFRHQVNEVCR